MCGLLLIRLSIQINEAFDACLEYVYYVYGLSYGRDNPHKGAKDTAERWIGAGLTLPVACLVDRNGTSFGITVILLCMSASPIQTTQRSEPNHCRHATLW
jgi:hypothetical protein